MPQPSSLPHSISRRRQQPRHRVPVGISATAPLAEHGQLLIDDFGSTRQNGGAAAFLQFIDTQIPSAVAKIASIDSQQQTL